MAYVAQLLPDIDEARVLREALVNHTNNDINEGDRDIAWALLAKLTSDMRKHERDAQNRRF